MPVQPSSRTPSAVRAERAPAGAFSTAGFLLLVEFSSGLLQGSLFPLLPGILHRYGTTAADLNWVSALWLLSAAFCVPLLSALGDRHGHRRVLTAALTLTALGSVLVATAPTFGVLLLGRVVQGPLVALQPLEFAVVRERAGARAGRPIALLVGALLVGTNLGLLLGGVAAEHLGLAVALGIPASLLVAAVPVVATLVPETTARTGGRIDRVGAGLLSVGLVVLLAVIGQGGTWGWTDPKTLGGTVGGLAVLATWVAVERRVPAPFVDLPAVLRGGLGLPILTGFFFGAELLGSGAANVLFLTLPASTGFGLGLPAARVGPVLVVLGAGVFVGTWLAPRLRDRLGSRATVLGGAVLMAAGYLWTALVHRTVGELVAGQVLANVGNGLLLVALAAHVALHAPRNAVGLCSGLFALSRTIGGAVVGAVTVAVMSAVLTRLPDGTVTTSEAGYTTVWLISAALALVVAALAVRLTGPRTPMVLAPTW